MAGKKIIMRTGEALVEADDAWSAAEPEVVIGELDGPVGYAIANLIASRDGASRGVFNNGGIVNARIDELSGLIAVETDATKRQGMMSEVGKIVRDEALYIPLHQQQIVWAARSNVEVVQTADNFIQLRHVRVQPK